MREREEGKEREGGGGERRRVWERGRRRKRDGQTVA